MALLALLCLVATTWGAGCGGTSPVSRSPSSPARPNIVFVLTDDLSTNLLRFMPTVQAMERAGMSFSNYTVTDSLCCPSRSSIFTGDYPHDTGVFTNSPPHGGYRVFRQQGEENSTFALALQRAGYRTALLGKYLNGYHPAAAPGLPSVRPPGWDEWGGVGNGYAEYGYLMAENGSTRFYDHQPGDYLTTVLQGRATDFISASAASGQPFFLEVATFAPHHPYVPAPADTAALRGLRAPRTKAFDRLPTHPPRWLHHRHALTRREKHAINVDYRLRARDVRSVDRLVAAVYQALRAAGVSNQTDVIFSSDNGYHMGEYRLNPGKMTAFETDINVPLVATGPGIAAASSSQEVVQNIDLAPTFEALAGLPADPTMDGNSIVDLLQARPVHGWTTAALVEHRGPDRNRGDPDFPQLGSGNPPSYEALRTATFTYVEYRHGGAEYYQRTRDPHELHNVIAQLSATRRAHLRHELHRLAHCHGVAACTVARSGP